MRANQETQRWHAALLWPFLDTYSSGCMYFDRVEGSGRVLTVLLVPSPPLSAMFVRFLLSLSDNEWWAREGLRAEKMSAIGLSGSKASIEMETEGTRELKMSGTPVA